LGGRDAPNLADRYGNLDHNDVWLSTNKAASWSLVTSAAAWAPRDQHSWAISTQGVMVVYGGSTQGGYLGFFSDAWSSVDGGQTWQLLAQTTSIGNYSQCATIFDSAGYLYLFGGQTLGYNWVDVAVRSTVSLNAVALSSTGPGPTSAAAPRLSSPILALATVISAIFVMLLHASV